MSFHKLILIKICICLIWQQSYSLPSRTTNSFVVSTKLPSSRKESIIQNGLVDLPQIYEMFVKSNVKNRYAYTTVTSKVRNLANKAQEAKFAVILPESAFVSGFVMEVNGKNYTAYVKEKEEAQAAYNQAVVRGQGAAHVAVSARDSNRFTVTVNIEPNTEAAFYLSYEELLQRQNSLYNLVINLHPGQPVADLRVEVLLAESRKLTEVKALPIRSGNEIVTDKTELDPRAIIERYNDTSAVIRFIPDVETQKYFARCLGSNEDKGLAGQFVVQYDVERDPKGGEVLIQDGYFVHFFAPNELRPLPKHVIFVLDTSSSMNFKKIKQLKEAMRKILEQLHDRDIFHLVEFNTETKVWNLNSPESSVTYTKDDRLYAFFGQSQDSVQYQSRSTPNAFAVNTDNIRKAKAAVSRLNARGATDIHNSLRVGLYLIELAKRKNNEDVLYEPMIIFLTDGDPTVGLTNTDEIIEKITEMNSNLVRKAAIFTLSFGSDADRDFLQKLSFRNSGFSRHIYEAADVPLQLQNFYNHISSPLLSGVTFNYQSSADSLTTTQFPLHFDGSELIVAGKYSGNAGEFAQSNVEAWDGKKRVSFNPTVSNSISSIERLWAYLTVKQLLNKKEISDDYRAQMTKRALDLSIQYSFVTSVSSLVVVKPTTVDVVDTEVADNESKNIKPRLVLKPATPAPSPPWTGNVFTVTNNVVFNPVLVTTNMDTFRPDTAVLRPIDTQHFDFCSSCQEPSFTSTNKPSGLDLLNKLPWLNDYVFEDDTITLDAGNFKLGMSEIITDSVSCSKTPQNKPGHCKLLNACPQVHSVLQNVDVFLQHFCLLRNTYAGVCCPDDTS